VLKRGVVEARTAFLQVADQHIAHRSALDAFWAVGQV
jgi:hypothetical protein